LNPLEEYLRELHNIRRSGSAVAETSYYPALRDLMDAVGAGGALRSASRIASMKGINGAIITARYYDRMGVPRLAG